jgi:outer membrane protein
MTKIGLACAALVVATGAFAQKAGDNIISLGLASIETDVKAGAFTSTSPDPVAARTAATFTGALKDASANISNATTISVGLLHMYTDNIGGEFTLGIPPEVTQDLNTPNGSAKMHTAAAKITLWTPTAVAKYFLGSPSDQSRPYVGFGVSRVSFHNVKTNPGDSTVQALAGTSAEFSSAWAPVYNVGVIYKLDSKWSINGSMSYIPVKTTATFNGPGNPLVSSYPVTSVGDIKLNTMDYVVRLGYSF